MALRDRLAKSGITSLIKKVKPKPKPKPKPSTAITKTKPASPKVIPSEMVAPFVGSGKVIQSTLRSIGRNPGRPEGSAVTGAIRAAGYGGVPAAGLYMGLTGDDEKTKVSPPIEKVSGLKEVNDSDALKDILKQKTMEIAMEAGRESPVFLDYVKAFPSSYMEKVSRDPEFAKQMMAGFLAMMQPSEGFVPRNAISDFGQAAMEEGARQEDAMTDQEQLLAMSDEDIKKLQKIQAGASPIDQTAIAGAAALLAQFRKELTNKKDGKLTDLNGNEINLISFLAMFQQTGGDITQLAEMIVAGE